MPGPEFDREVRVLDTDGRFVVKLQRIGRILAGKTSSSGTFEYRAIVDGEKGKLTLRGGESPLFSTGQIEFRSSGNQLLGSLTGYQLSLPGSHYAVEFKGVSTTEFGTVMVMGPRDSVVPCSTRNNKRVVGVVASGIGTAVYLKSGEAGGKVSVAVAGIALCKVDATTVPVEVGDMLVTSDTVGHAQRLVSQRIEATLLSEGSDGPADVPPYPGMILGKALAPLARRQRGVIPVLVSLS
jgi:hypothetical protein